MKIVTIHESGQGSDKLTVDSWGNGWGHAIQFGEAGSPMRTLWFQDEDSTILRDEFDAMETARPNVSTREIWLDVLDPYL